jgi:hypothetical protein
MKTLKPIILILMVFCFSFCTNKEDTNENEINSTYVNGIDGAYVGTYTQTNLTNDMSVKTIPTIELKNGKYTFEGIFCDTPNDNGFGNFTIKGNKIIFELTGYYLPVDLLVVEGYYNHWLLEGEYEYRFDGNKLTFSKTATVYGDKYNYEFELTRNR